MGTRTTTWCEFSHALPEQREGVPSCIPSHIDSHYGRVVGTIPTDRQSWLPPPTPTDAVVRLQVLSDPDHPRPTAFMPSPALLVVACQPSPPPSSRRLLNQGEAPRRTLTQTLFIPFSPAAISLPSLPPPHSSTIRLGRELDGPPSHAGPIKGTCEFTHRSM